jgi:hypothetical protein
VKRKEKKYADFAGTNVKILDRFSPKNGTDILRLKIQVFVQKNRLHFLPKVVKIA